MKVQEAPLSSRSQKSSGLLMARTLPPVPPRQYQAAAELNSVTRCSSCFSFQRTSAATALLNRIDRAPRRPAL